MADPNQLLARYEQLLATLIGDDNNARRQAEAAYEAMKADADAVALGLLHCARYSARPELRNEAIILLRGLLIKTEKNPGAWTRISPAGQAHVRGELLAALELEQNDVSRGFFCDIIAELGSMVLAEGQWPELLPFLFRWSKSESPAQRESALRIFSQLALLLGHVLRPFFNVLYEVLAANLNFAGSLPVRLAALDATCAVVLVLHNDTERGMLQQLVPAMLNCLEAALNDTDQKRAREALETFVDLAEQEPGFLRPQIVPITTAMFHIALAKQLEPATRQFGLEFLVTLTEAKAALVKKIPNFVQTLVPLLLNLMLDIPDLTLQEWNALEDDDDTETSDNKIASQSLDRIACALRGKTLVPVLFEHMPRMLRNAAQWKERYAALIAISLVAEGCIKFLEPHLQQVLEMVVPMINDPEPRVRYAACQTMGQMCTDFTATLQQNHHAQILPALMALMDDVQNPRVQSHAASAIINFCDGARATTMKPYLDGLLFKLATLLRQNVKMVMEQALTAVAAIADCVEEEFAKYYDTFMPFLISVLQSAVSKEYRLLRGKAIECVSLIGVSVGKERFLRDVRVVMEELAKTQMQQADDDPQTSFTLQAWARICKCLGKDFVPYMHVVMPPLLRSAKIVPEVQVVGDPDEAKEGWEVMNYQGQNIAMRSSSLEEKATAINMLYCYSSDLKEGFYPYVQECATILIPLLGFDVHDGIRSSAAQTMPHLLRCVEAHFGSQDKTPVVQLWSEICPPLIEAIMETEADCELLQALIEPLHLCIEIVGTGITLEQLTAITGLIKGQLHDNELRQQERTANEGDQDFDEEEAERIEVQREKEDELLAEVSECIGSCAKVVGPNFLPFYVQELHTYMQRLLGQRRAQDRKIAICVIDDIMEFCGPQFTPVMLGLMPVYLAGLQDESPEVRQAVAYGIGVCAQHMREELHGLLPDLLRLLNQMITAPGSRTGEAAFATENAIVSFGKLLQYHHTAMDAPVMLRTWLDYLPVTQDEDEGPITYGLFCHFMETQTAVMAGQDWANLPKLLAIMGTALGTPMVNTEVTARMVNILRGIRSVVPAAALQAAFTGLPAEIQSKLLAAQQ